MRCLVTGGAGFIGSNFIRYLLKKDSDIQILNFDKLTYAGNLLNLKDIEEDGNYRFVKGDICAENDLKPVFKDFKPDFVFNFAAESHVDRSIYDPTAFVKTNVLGTQKLLSMCQRHGIERYVQISTDEVYGSLPDEGRFTENTPLDPTSPYSASKASADLLVNAHHLTYGLPVNITRCSNNYGPYQFPEKLIPLVIMNCLLQKEIPVYGDGLNVRDWIHVKDHCEAVFMVAKKDVPGETYNIGADNEVKNIDLVKSIIRIMSEISPESCASEDLIRFVKDRPGHDRRYAIDSQKIREKIGWKPVMDFESGLKETIKWYIKNSEWLKWVNNKDYQKYYERNYSKRG